MIDLIKAYGNRIIEGIDVGDINDALHNKSTTFSYDGKMFTHIPSGKKVVLKCVQKYFEPPKDYYHLTQKDNCEFIKYALEITEAHSCSQCLNACIQKGLKIKSEVRRR